MKITINEAYNIFQNLNELADKDLPIKTSYKILKLAKQLQIEMDVMEESRKKIAAKYSEDGESVDADKVSDFRKDFAEILNQEIEVEWEKIPIEELGDIKLNVKTMSAIEQLVI